MPHDHILSLVIAERDKLNAAIEALQGSKRGRSAKNPAAVPKRKKRTFTAEQRKQQAERMKEFWRKKRAAQKKYPPKLLSGRGRALGVASSSGIEAVKVSVAPNAVP